MVRGSGSVTSGLVRTTDAASFTSANVPAATCPSNATSRTPVPPAGGILLGPLGMRREQGVLGRGGRHHAALFVDSNSLRRSGSDVHTNRDAQRVPAAPALRTQAWSEPMMRRRVGLPPGIATTSPQS